MVNLVIMLIKSSFTGIAKWSCFVYCRFNQILCQRSFAHLRAVFEEYGKISKKTVEDAIKSEFSGDIKDGLLTVGMKHTFLSFMMTSYFMTFAIL